MLRFGKGSNLLVGPMGAGKTSALDAICFALFGTFPALKSRAVRLEEVVMARPKKKDRAEVEMVFDAAGQTYSVSRTIGARGGSDALLKVGGRTIDAQSQRVTEAVEKLLGINYELFTRAIYSEQNKIDYFIALGKGERKKQVDELLGIDRFEAARAGAATALNLAEGMRKDALKSIGESGFEDAERDAARAAREIGENAARISENEKKLAALVEKKR